LTMIRLCSVPNPTLAHVLRGALEAAGIPAEVRGGFLFSTRGESPVTVDTEPALWIPEDADLDLAREIVREFEAPASNGPVGLWRCSRCGETSEAQFDRCWNCGEIKTS